MPDHKVILFYRFATVPDPESVMHWQRNVAQRLGLLGRVIVAPQGINATLGGEVGALKQYVRDLERSTMFRGTQMKWSHGTGADFPRLSVRVRPELVTLDPDVEFDPCDPGVGLGPEAWHELITTRDDVLLLDARNAYESAIGRFAGAVTPDIRTFREIKETVDGIPRDQPIATYCTGDVRCEYLSGYMRQLGFSEVYHLEGGIMEYGRRFRDEGAWDGHCYVFDARRSVAFASGVEPIGVCEVCGEATAGTASCMEEQCFDQLVVCDSCRTSAVECAADMRCDGCRRTTV